MQRGQPKPSSSLVLLGSHRFADNANRFVGFTVAVNLLGQTSLVLAVVFLGVLLHEPALKASVFGTVTLPLVVTNSEQQEGRNVPKVVNTDLELAIEPSLDVVGSGSVEVEGFATDLDGASTVTVEGF